MSRVNLFEFEDFGWFPQVLRNHMTSFLEMGHKILRPPAFWIDFLEMVLRHQNTDLVFDLCSGSGGPLFEIEGIVNKTREHKVKFVLSDLYPNADCLEFIKKGGKQNFCYLKDPVAAHTVPQGWRGVSTLIAGFHHFPEPEARAIVKPSGSMPSRFPFHQLPQTAPPVM